MRFKLEKVDKYDVTKVMDQNNVHLGHSFGKSSLVEVERLLTADKMLIDSIALFGDKIIMILLLIDVKPKQ
jgi:hypothetical protein